MRWNDYIDADEVRKAITVLQEPSGVFEIRAIGTAKKDILSGYFRDAETLLKEFDNIDMRSRNVYVTLQQVKPECFARAQSEHFLKSPQTSSDTEIIRYRWLFVDLDPVRSAGISSSDTELGYAQEMAIEVCNYLAGLGFESPVKAISGNGYHLLYRIDVLNDAEGRSLVERCLKALAERFNTDQVKIDTTNSNPSRICKLHGTLAQKGRNTRDRPHRMSKIISVPKHVEVTNTDVLKGLAEEVPEEQKYERKDSHISSGIHSEFDLIDFMQRNRITYTEDSNDRATIYKLDECPFDPSHKDGDAKIFQYRNGAVAFKCHHNSCRQYKWQDVRLKFEPDAYDRINPDDERFDAAWNLHKQIQAEEHKKEQKPVTDQAGKKSKKIRKLKTAEALMKKDLPEPKVFVGVDEELPFLLEGTCILSAKPKLGKSWLALGMCIAVANGDDFLGYKTRRCSTLYLDLETSETLQQKRLRKVLHGEPVPKNFYLETETNNLDNGFIEQIEAYLEEDPDIGIVVIDVFQIVRTAAKGIKETEYEHAYRDITPLNELAQRRHISIILVCHDRKAVDPDDPFSNILGSTGLQGAATQMIVMFRKRKEDPIHISIKGKTIDGLPELDVRLDNAQWSIVEGGNPAEREQAGLMRDYKESDIRAAVLAISDKYSLWQGASRQLIETSVEINSPIMESSMATGGFINKHLARFLAVDGIKITVIHNGTGAKKYRIEKATVDTVDENDTVTVDGFMNLSEYGACEIPFS